MQKLIFPMAVVFLSVCCSWAAGLEDRIPRNQKPLLNVYPPSAAEQSKPGTGKFIIFTREQIGKDWNFIAGAWECIPSEPEKPITKRVEFCHSSWNADSLLNSLAADGSEGRHTRFQRLQVNSSQFDYTVNLYDINYRTWDVRCIWQGKQLMAFGAIGNDIYCSSDQDELLLDANTGKLSKEVPFTPLCSEGKYWLVRKPGETEGSWSYDTEKRQFIAHFQNVERSKKDYSYHLLSPDGQQMGWIIAPVPNEWRGGALTGQLILQRKDKAKDISVPMEMHAIAGSGVRVIPHGMKLDFTTQGKLELRTWKGAKPADEQVWRIDGRTGAISSGKEPHKPVVDEEDSSFNGVPLPDYLKKDAADFRYHGRGGLAAAFMFHMGIIKDEIGFANCHTGVSPDGQHVLFCAKKGEQKGVYIYGNLKTKQIIRWQAPPGLNPLDTQDFVWAETP